MLSAKQNLSSRTTSGSNMTGTNCDLFTHKSVPVIFEPPCKETITKTTPSVSPLQIQGVTLPLTEGVYLCPHRPSGCADRQRLLGALLPGTWHSAGRPDALRQDCRRRRRQFQHVLQRDWSRQTRATGRVRGPGAHSCR